MLILHKPWMFVTTVLFDSLVKTDIIHHFEFMFIFIHM